MKSVSTQQFKEQQEMNSLFKEHGTVNTKPETETGSAYFYGFRVMSHDKKNETLDLRLYFLAEDDVLVSKITYCKDNPHTLIKHLRSDNLGTLELSEMLGTEIEYKNKNEQWLVNGLDIEIEKFNTYIDDWEPMNSLSEEQQFIDFHHVDESDRFDNPKQEEVGNIHREKYYKFDDISFGYFRNRPYKNIADFMLSTSDDKKPEIMVTTANQTYTEPQEKRDMVAVIKATVVDIYTGSLMKWELEEIHSVERVSIDDTYENDIRYPTEGAIPEYMNES